ncbi:MAG TPA: tyrosine--tRNA ligase [Actinomycetota bacterium]|nr:tyrosine--tRNA ligase [Actinomycetota bacterium]
MSFLPAEQQLQALSRHARVAPEEEFREKLALGRPLRVKLGLDPTAGDVHLGWTVVLRRLRAFQDLGHTAVLILGDFTARIGDPSGQNKTRPMLSASEVREFAGVLVGQVRRILSDERLEVRYNSEWLEKLGVGGVLALTSHQTVARMLERDDFSQRYAAQSPITITEFLYPLLQGYDSVAVQADVEMGGNDQTFNLLVGRHIQPAYAQPPQVILTMPLLEGTDGVGKMSQSKGNYIGIEEPPDEMFGKLMRVPDPLMIKYLELVTDLPGQEVEQVSSGVASGEVRPEAAKRRLAHSVVRMYHGAEAADAALERFDTVFRHHAMPQDIPERPLPDDCVQDGEVFVPRLLREVGFAESTAAGRRLIAQGGVRVDDKPLEAESVPADSLRGRVLQKGRRQFVRLV